MITQNTLQINSSKTSFFESRKRGLKFYSRIVLVKCNQANNNTVGSYIRYFSNTPYKKGGKKWYICMSFATLYNKTCRWCTVEKNNSISNFIELCSYANQHSTHTTPHRGTIRLKILIKCPNVLHKCVSRYKNKSKGKHTCF